MAEVGVTVITPRKVVFSGKARSVILPGEGGVFEILPFHKSILSRLVGGTLIIDEESILIKRGVVKMHQNNVTVIVEPEGDVSP